MRARHASETARSRHWLRKCLLLAVLAAVAFGAFEVLSGAYQVRPVLSGSMRPGLPVGGVVITERVPISSLQVRDVVVIHRPDDPQQLVVHRIIALSQGPNGVRVQTQGDANDVKDPWTVTLKGTSAYRAVYSIPLVGYAAVWMHNPDGRRILLVIGAVLLIGAAVSTVLRTRRRAAATAASEDAAGEPASDAESDADLDADTPADPAAAQVPVG
jgi:signal peptidase I